MAASHRRKVTLSRLAQCPPPLPEGLGCAGLDTSGTGGESARVRGERPPAISGAGREPSGEDIGKGWALGGYQGARGVARKQGHKGCVPGVA